MFQAIDSSMGSKPTPVKISPRPSDKPVIRNDARSAIKEYDDNLREYNISTEGRLSDIQKDRDESSNNNGGNLGGNFGGNLGGGKQGGDDFGHEFDSEFGGSLGDSLGGDFGSKLGGGVGGG